eukprot:225569-Rhodomonas_salina.2
MQASVQDRMFPPDGRGALGWVERVRACASAAKALLYLHMPDPAVGKPVILHRDIKPSNLLLDADGLVRLSDFGLARMHREGTKSHLTITQVGGTNGFIDPKYMQTGHCEPASDAYSLGVTVLVLLTGWAAFEPGEDTVYDRCDGREAGEVADPRAQWPADKAADMLRVGMGLADPRKRFRMTVAEALAVLRHTESDPDVDSVASERECLLCMALPRAVRLGCGHATYCRDCLAAALARPSPVCPHCSCPVVVDDIVMDDGIAVENTWVRPVQRPPGRAAGGGHASELTAVFLGGSVLLRALPRAQGFGLTVDGLGLGLRFGVWGLGYRVLAGAVSESLQNSCCAFRAKPAPKLAFSSANVLVHAIPLLNACRIRARSLMREPGVQRSTPCKDQPGCTLSSGQWYKEKRQTRRRQVTASICIARQTQYKFICTATKAFCTSWSVLPKEGKHSSARFKFDVLCQWRSKVSGTAVFQLIQELHTISFGISMLLRSLYCANKFVCSRYSGCLGESCDVLDQDSVTESILRGPPGHGIFAYYDTPSSNKKSKGFT